MDSAIKALGFVLLVLLIAVGFTAAISATGDTTTVTATIQEGDTETFESLQVDLLDSTSSDVTILVTNLNTGDTVEATVVEGDTHTFSFSGGDILITAEDTRETRSTLTIEYPNTFGFSEGSQIVTNNLPLILGAFALISIVAFVGVRK